MNTENKKTRKPRRTNKELNESLFKSLSEMMSNQKFREVGINDLTEYAQVEKNFIYNHYGDLDGVMREYVKRNDFWGRALDENIFANLSDKDVIQLMFKGLYQSFSENIDFQNIIRWEVASSNEYVKENAQKREKDAESIIKHFEKFKEKNPTKDVQCLVAIISAGIYYLILHKNISTFAGIDFSKQEEADRIVSLVENIVEQYFKDTI